MNPGNSMRAAARSIRAVATDERAVLDAAELDAVAARADVHTVCDGACEHVACADIRAGVHAARITLHVLDGVDVAHLMDSREALQTVEERWPATTPGDYPIAAVRHAYIAGFTNGAAAQRAALDGAQHAATPLRPPAGEPLAPTPLAVARAVAVALTEVTGVHLDAGEVRQVARRASGALLTGGDSLPGGRRPGVAAVS